MQMGSKPTKMTAASVDLDFLTRLFQFVEFTFVTFF